MKLNKSQSQFLHQAIKHWQEKGMLDASKAEELSQSIEPKGFDWKKLASYAFGIAVSCIAISLVILVSDNYTQELIEALGQTPDSVFFTFFALLAVLFFFLGIRKRKVQQQKKFSKEALLFGGVLASAGAITFLGKMMDNGSQHFSILLLLSTLLYTSLGWYTKSKQIWVFGLISIAGWFGTETAYQTDWGNYFLGMNYPLRFALFGALLFAFIQLFRNKKAFRTLYPASSTLALIYMFCSLWLLSIFGNYGDINSWEEGESTEHIVWAVVALLIAAGFFVEGLKNNNDRHREFGIIFLLLNLYSRYFEYLWEPMHKAIFFAILALSFWGIGKMAEKFWFRKKDHEEIPET